MQIKSWKYYPKHFIDKLSGKYRLVKAVSLTALSKGQRPL
jgi:hypothetical protein